MNKYQRDVEYNMRRGTFNLLVKSYININMRI